MSKKSRFLDKAQRDLVHSKFIVDERYISQLKPRISDWFKKMKPLPGLSRIFQDYNKRFFSLNLPEISLYYTQKERYSASEITYISFEEVMYISDKPHYALSNQGVEWKEAFGLTIYLSDKYIVLVAQSNEIYMLWLNYFEAIRFRDTKKSILNRSRTPYLSNTFIINLPDFQIPQEQQGTIFQINQNEVDQKTINQNSKQHSPCEIIHQNIELNSPQQENLSLGLLPQEENDNDNGRQKYIQIENQQTIFNKEIEQKEIKFDYQQQQQLQDEETIQQQEIIQVIQPSLEIKKQQDQFSYSIPKRLDSRSKNRQNSISKINNQNTSLQSTLKKQITNIWGTYDLEGNEIIKPKILQSNFITTQDPNQKENGMFLNLKDLPQNTETIEQPDLIIKFDELESARHQDTN